jgi:Tfp pilus assembly protein PilV
MADGGVRVAALGRGASRYERGLDWDKTSARNPKFASPNPPSRTGGFNLVEALVATMILSGAVLTLGAIGTNALSNTRLHRHYEMAAAVVDKQLSLIDYMGIDAFIQAGQMEGIVEEMEPAFQWTVATEYQGTDSLYMVVITVTWLEGNRPHSVTAQTMLDGTGSVTSPGASTDSGGQQAQ